MKTLIHGGTLIGKAGTTRNADVLLDGGRIAAVGEGLSRTPGAADAEVHDATGKYVLPGGIDAHTHITLNLEAARGTDVYFTGTVPAALGGTTCIVDHLAFRPDAMSLGDELAEYLHLAAGRSAVDYAFHGLVQNAGPEELEALSLVARMGLKSVKAYTTYAGRLDDAGLLRALARTRELGLVLIVHAETHDTIAALRARYKSEGKLAPVWHAKSRPPESESGAVARVLELARQAGDAPVYIAHLSTASGLEQIRKARRAGQSNIYAETCTQYLTLTEDRYREEDGCRYIMAPPLRAQHDIDALWQGLADGDIQTVGSDHCAFTLADKAAGRHDFTRCPGGAPGLNERLAVLFSEGVVAGRINALRFIEVASSNPAAIFGLHNKGRIEAGADADLYVLNPERAPRIYLPEPGSYSLYAGRALKGRIEAVWLAGNRIVTDGEYTGARGLGAFTGRR